MFFRQNNTLKKYIPSIDLNKLIESYEFFIFCYYVISVQNSGFKNIFCKWKLSQEKKYKRYFLSFKHDRITY